MTAASTSDARKRNTSPVDPVEVVARALAPTRIGPFGPNTMSLLANGMTTQMTPGEVGDASHAIVNALRENGFTL